VSAGEQEERGVPYSPFEDALSPRPTANGAADAAAGALPRRSVGALRGLLGRGVAPRAIATAVSVGLFALVRARAPRGARPAVCLGAVAGLAWLLADALVQGQTAKARARAAAERLHEHEAYLLGASHELRSPLSKATMALEYILEHADETTRAIGQAAVYELHHLMVTLENMLELARLRSGNVTVNLQDVDIVELVRQRVAAAQGDEGRHVLVVEAPSELPCVQTDPARLAQVIDNLLSNAIKYSPEHSEVYVRVSETPSAITIAVRDQGIGIAPEDRERIFERYYRSANGRNIGGVGLGLFITRALIENLGGRIEVDSELGRGSEFRVILPRSPSALSLPASAS
jgi:signal transduction histidine kinase